MITLALPKGSLDAQTHDEPIENVSQIRPNSRVMTEYSKLTRKFFEKLGIPVQMFHSYGTAEAKGQDLMDVDLTETGTTLRKNGLKIIGQIMESHTAVPTKKNWADLQKRKEIEEIKTLLFRVIDARHKVLLTMKKPTVSQLHGIDDYSIQTIVPKSAVNGLIPTLKACGTEDILEIPISKIVP
jgi:ATP phosphoribosyltransferase